MASPSSVLTLGQNYTPGLVITLGYGSALIAPVPSRACIDWAEVYPTVSFDDVEVAPVVKAEISLRPLIEADDIGVECCC